MTGATGGSHDRIDCFTASRTIAAQRWRPFSAFGPSQRDTERAAAHGTIASTPSSVAACTASSSRSPFASACTSVMRVAGGSSTTMSSASSASSRGPVEATTPCTRMPRPSPIAIRSPARTRDTVTACRASSPESRTTEPGATVGEVERLVEVEVAHRGIRQPRKRSRRRAKRPCWKCVSSGAGAFFEAANCCIRSRSFDESFVGVTTCTPILRSPRPAAAEPGDAAVLDGEDLAALQAGSQLHVDVAVERGDRRVRAEDRVGHRHLERAQQVVAVAAEDVVVADLDLEVEVAVRAAGGAGLARARHLQAHARVDAGGDVDRHGAARTHAALALAGDARASR